MNDMLDLYRMAERRGIGVYWFSLGEAESLSYRDGDGDCFIAMDPWKLPTLADETVKLCHELGHCETGSFYNRWAARDVRQKHENRANRWAIQTLIPEETLLAQVAEGYTEPWELAERFGVTEPFMEMAMEFYSHA